MRHPPSVTSEKEPQPLYRDPSREQIAKQVAEFTDDTVFHHGVYVLVCKQIPTGEAERVAVNQERWAKLPWWLSVGDTYSKLLYVGVSKRVVERIYLHAIGSGARFTRIFPPIKVQSIDWYPSLAESYRAERRKAAILDRNTSDSTFVMYPG